MQTMRDRIARCAYEGHKPRSRKYETLELYERRQWLASADAVLEELREPDEGVINAIHDAWSDGEDLVGQWRAGIDHSRKEDVG